MQYLAAKYSISDLSSTMLLKHMSICLALTYMSCILSDSFPLPVFNIWDNFYVWQQQMDPNTSNIISLITQLVSAVILSEGQLLQLSH